MVGNSTSHYRKFHQKSVCTFFYIFSFFAKKAPSATSRLYQFSAWLCQTRTKSLFIYFWGEGGWEKIGVMLRRAGTNVLNIFSTSRNEVGLFRRAHWKNQKWSHNASRNKISMTTDQFRKFCDVLDTADNEQKAYKRVIHGETLWWENLI